MKKGFTLIELLAVIVILAIIAVIAVPIVLNIINDSKENSNKRSIDMYAKAVENAVASYKLNGNSLSGEFITTDGKTVVSKTDSNIKFNVDYSGSKVVCETFKIYENGKFYLSDCKVDDALVTNYSKGEEQKEPSCTIERQNEGTYTIGDIVTCELTETTDKFYVIQNTTIDAQTIELLPEKNIHITEFRQSDNAGTTDFTYYEDNTKDLLTPIIDGYVLYLNQSNLGAIGSVIDESQLERLGCFWSNLDPKAYCQGTSENEGEVVGAAPSWVYTPTYWGPTAFGQIDTRWYVSQIIDYEYTYPGSSGRGVRPVIIINTSEIR